MEFWFNDMHTQNVQLSIRVEKQLFFRRKRLSAHRRV